MKDSRENPHYRVPDIIQMVDNVVLKLSGFLERLDGNSIALVVNRIGKPPVTGAGARKVCSLVHVGDLSSLKLQSTDADGFKLVAECQAVSAATEDVHIVEDHGMFVITFLPKPKGFKSRRQGS